MMEFRKPEAFMKLKAFLKVHMKLKAHMQLKAHTLVEQGGFPLLSKCRVKFNLIVFSLDISMVLPKK